MCRFRGCLGVKRRVRWWVEERWGTEDCGSSQLVPSEMPLVFTVRLLRESSTEVLASRLKLVQE
uniref:Uncharacterized protein n=1 Tax=Physcomitrium patens TaxID=3218 RepID=A0A7I4FBK9_PHYPA